MQLARNSGSDSSVCDAMSILFNNCQNVHVEPGIEFPP